MNKIIFDKHMKYSGADLIIKKLSLPPVKNKKETQYYGMKLIPEHDFPEQFSKFC